MSTIYAPTRRPRSRRSGTFYLEQILLVLLAGFLIFTAAAVLTYAGMRVWYAGRILPGVSVAGVDVGGLNPAQAASLLSTQVTYPTAGKIALKDQANLWVVTPTELGLSLNSAASAEAAFEVGRRGFIVARIMEQIEAASYGWELAPVFVQDQRAAFVYLQKLAQSIDHPAQDAAISLNGTAVTATPSQTGRTLDMQSNLILLSLQMQQVQNGVINLIVRETRPAILDASAQADLARKILSAPLTMDLPGAEAGKDGAPWTLQPDQLAKMITIEKTGSAGAQSYQVGLREDLLRSYLADLGPKLTRDPQNARFTFNDDTHQLELLQPARIGRALDAAASLTAIETKLRAGEHYAPLVVSYTNPAVTDQATGKQLGITELIHSETSYFRGSSTARVQNITAAAAKFHGLLVAPGETFSMASAIGDITLDNGFAEALIIVGGQTIKGVGGGVCQVSTTLFRNAFFSGFPIVQRYAHAYRVGYYEQTATGHDVKLAGLDATVFVPLVDFKFKNDTPYWLLMETYVNGYSLTWKFYSTSDGRKVDWTTSGPTNVVPPPDPIYRENPDLKKGDIRQVDWAAEGSDVSVTRTVYAKDGSVYFNDNLNTHYEAWQDVFEYGPGTDIPAKK